MFAWFRRPVLLFVVILTAAGQVSGQQTVGVFLNDPGSFQGYTLFSPFDSDTTYLISNDGQLVHSWVTTGMPGTMGYLTEDGSLLRSIEVTNPHPNFASGAGRGGGIELYDWDGTLVWEYELSNAQFTLHHDIRMLPNGNVLMMAWEFKDSAESIAAGRDPAKLSNAALWPERILEIAPTLPSGGTIVWEWSTWDHLVQDYDALKDNHGVVADHPELIDLNFVPHGIDADWNHFNGMDYNPALDQIVISVHRFNEFWVIDHSTTTAEAAGHTGGDSGLGGDLMYRWGNPEAYGAGISTDRKLFRQHDAQWIAPGRPGAGNFLLYNNGWGRPAGSFSTADEIAPPVEPDGSYTLDPGPAFGPTSLFWTYSAPTPTDFYSQIISGVERLPNGNTLICQGVTGDSFEVTAAGQEVWRYVSPVTATGPVDQGDPVAGNSIFKVRRYAPDYPGLAGRDLSPQGSLEGMAGAPLGVPDGSGGTNALSATRLTPGGDELEVLWDSVSCASDGYHLIYGDLAQVSSYEIQGAECGVDPDGSYTWTGVAPGDLFFLVVGFESTFGIYEGSWGLDGSGKERPSSAGATACGTISKLVSSSCP